MVLFFKFIGRAFRDLFTHLYLAIKYFFKNLFKAFWHPSRKKNIETFDSFSKPKFVGAKEDLPPKKRKHRGGRRHRGGRKHRHHGNRENPPT